MENMPLELREELEEIAGIVPESATIRVMSLGGEGKDIGEQLKEVLGGRIGQDDPKKKAVDVAKTETGRLAVVGLVVMELGGLGKKLQDLEKGGMKPLGVEITKGGERIDVNVLLQIIVRSLVKVEGDKEGLLKGLLDDLLNPE